jgi:hypothetical protein
VKFKSNQIKVDALLERQRELEKVLETQSRKNNDTARNLQILKDQKRARQEILKM